MLQIIEQYGVPIAVAIAFGFFIWKQNKFIQDTLMQELDESFGRLEAIIIKLIDAQKVALMELKATKAMLDTMIKINEANKKSCKECGRELDG
jgi:predicted nucleic-acid-binding protein